MKPFNPRNLTPAQIGNGWRLLDEDELVHAYGHYRIIRVWNRLRDSAPWDHWLGNDMHPLTFWEGYMWRTQLTREELAKHRIE